MDHAFWLDRWQRADTGFHQAAAHDMLARHWPALGVAPASLVLVPLCGKSLDLVWLAEHGHEVVGTELAELAVQQFFTERSRQPALVTKGGFTVVRAGPYEIWCGDHFNLDPSVTRRARGVFDRAALVAMPRLMQDDYADKLAELIMPGTIVLLVTLDYDPSQMEGPPFPITATRVEELFARNFRIELLERRDGLEASPNLKKRGLTWLDEMAWKLVRR